MPHLPGHITPPPTDYSYGSPAGNKLAMDFYLKTLTSGQRQFLQTEYNQRRAGGEEVDIETIMREKWPNLGQAIAPIGTTKTVPGLPTETPKIISDGGPIPGTPGERVTGGPTIPSGPSTAVTGSLPPPVGQTQGPLDPSGRPIDPNLAASLEDEDLGTPATQPGIGAGTTVPTAPAMEEPEYGGPGLAPAVTPEPVASPAIPGITSQQSANMIYKRIRDEYEAEAKAEGDTVNYAQVLSDYEQALTDQGINPSSVTAPTQLGQVLPVDMPVTRDGGALPGAGGPRGPAEEPTEVTTPFESGIRASFARHLIPGGPGVIQETDEYGQPTGRWLDSGGNFVAAPAGTDTGVQLVSGVGGQGDQPPTPHEPEGPPGPLGDTEMLPEGFTWSRLGTTLGAFVDEWAGSGIMGEREQRVIPWSAQQDLFLELGLLNTMADIEKFKDPKNEDFRKQIRDKVAGMMTVTIGRGGMEDQHLQWADPKSTDAGSKKSWEDMLAGIEVPGVLPGGPGVTGYLTRELAGRIADHGGKDLQSLLDSGLTIAQVVDQFATLDSMEAMRTGGIITLEEYTNLIKSWVTSHPGESIISADPEVNAIRSDIFMEPGSTRTREDILVNPARPGGGPPEPPDKEPARPPSYLDPTIIQNAEDFTSAESIDYASGATVRAWRNFDFNTISADPGSVLSRTGPLAPPAVANFEFDLELGQYVGMQRYDPETDTNIQAGTPNDQMAWSAATYRATKDVYQRAQKMAVKQQEIKFETDRTTTALADTNKKLTTAMRGGNISMATALQFDREAQERIAKAQDITLFSFREVAALISDPQTALLAKRSGLLQKLAFDVGMNMDEIIPKRMDEETVKTLMKTLGPLTAEELLPRLSEMVWLSGWSIEELVVYVQGSKARQLAERQAERGLGGPGYATQGVRTVTEAPR